jgi:hypothetical protein
MFCRPGLPLRRYQVVVSLYSSPAGQPLPFWYKVEIMTFEWPDLCFSFVRTHSNGGLGFKNYYLDMYN